MQPKATPSARLDDFDLQRFKEMTESEPFKLFAARVTAELKRAEEACVRETEDVPVRRAQGAVVSLRTVLALPAQLIAEMKSGKR